MKIIYYPRVTTLFRGADRYCEGWTGAVMHVINAGPPVVVWQGRRRSKKTTAEAETIMIYNEIIATTGLPHEKLVYSEDWWEQSTA